MNEELLQYMDHQAHVALIEAFYERKITNQKYKAGLAWVVACARLRKQIEEIPDTDEQCPPEILERGQLLYDNAVLAKKRFEEA